MTGRSKTLSQAREPIASIPTQCTKKEEGGSTCDVERASMFDPKVRTLPRHGRRQAFLPQHAYAFVTHHLELRRNSLNFND